MGADAGLLVAIFLPTFGVALVIASTTIFYLHRRRTVRRIRLDTESQAPASPLRKYVIRGGKVVPARPASYNRPAGWSTPTRLSQYFSEVSSAAKSRVSTLRFSTTSSVRDRDSIIPPLPANSRLQRRAAKQQLTLDLEKGIRPHTQPELIPLPLPSSGPAKGHPQVTVAKKPYAEIQSSMNRATQVQVLETAYDADTVVSPPAPVRHSRQNSRSGSVTRAGGPVGHVTRTASPSVKRARRNLSGQSFLDGPSQEQLKTFLDSSSGSPPQKYSPPHADSAQIRPPPPLDPLVSPKTTSPLIAVSPRSTRSPPTPAYHSPLQSRYYIDPATNRSRLSNHSSRQPSRLPSLPSRWGSLSSVPGAPPPVPRRPSQHSRLNSVSSVDSNLPDIGLGISAAASPISPATFISPSSSTRRP